MWRLSLIAGLSLCYSGSLAQCGPCAWGDTCTVDPPFPTVCPAIPPAAYVGVPYSVDVTFWVPPSFPEPTTQLNVVLDEVSLDAVENIPVGLTYEASSPDLTYHPQINPFGCVRVCGVPLIAGPDTIRINVSATGTVGGVSTSQPYVLSLPISVLAWPTDSITGFGFAPDSSCAPADVLFWSDFGAPQGVDVEHEWTFGNGSSFSGAAPPVQSYADGGTFPVSLTRTYSAAVVSSLTVNGVSNAWCSDLDEPNLPIIGCVGQPDLYFTITDSRLGLERSTLMQNVTGGTWPTPGIVLGFPPFVLRVFDSDALSADDLLGTFTFDGAPGVHAFGAGGTTGSISIGYQQITSLITSDSITVLAPPSIEFSFDDVNGFLCVTNDSLSAYEWSLDGIAVPDETGPCASAQNGLWSVSVTDAYGCSSSAEFLISGVGISGADRAQRALSASVMHGNLLRIDHPSTMPSARISVFDAEGRAVQNSTTSLVGSGQTIVRLPELPMGVYSIAVSAGQDRATLTFVVIR